MKTILAIDGSCLAHHAFYTLQKLSAGEVGTGVMFGMLNMVLNLAQRYGTNRIAWCWDANPTVRKKAYPEYKAQRRKDETPEQHAARKEMYGQVKLMIDRWIPAMGFKNSFWMDGWEADDMLASVVEDVKESESYTGREQKVVIVTNDNDLLQLLDDRVIMYSVTTGEEKTKPWFEKRYGLPPKMWAEVKAIAGCSGDNVIGIRGVGEKTAVKFLLGELNPKTKAFASIQENKKIIRRNFPLVVLPHSCSPRLELREEEFDEADFAKVFKKLKMKSMLASDRWLSWEGFASGDFEDMPPQQTHRFMKTRRRW